MQINRHTLANGLKIVHNFDPSTSMIGLTVLYDVGSKDESAEKTGLAHLLEHLMFEGSVHIPDFDMVLQNAGGENNAWTNNDMTCFYQSIPCQNIETALWLESDRMLSLAFTPKGLEVQKHVVIEEFKETCLNRPYGDVQHITRKLAYQKHPYRWPVIGINFKQIEQLEIEDVKNFFFHHYAPNNAILSISGNIAFDKMVALVEKWFEGIDKREINRRNYPDEPAQLSPRFVEVEREVPSEAIYKVYHMCGRKDKDYYTCDLLSDILANGRSSRLYKDLLMGGNLFSEINAFVSGETDPGTFQIQGKLIEGARLEDADKAIEEETKKLCSHYLSDHELEKVKNKYESNDLFANMNYLDKSTNAAFFELLGDAKEINSEVEKYRNITKEQVLALAQKIFDENNCSTVFYKKKSKN